jgi:hypothetical protein
MLDNLNPKPKEREKIDTLMIQADCAVRAFKKFDLTHGLGQTFWEYSNDKATSVFLECVCVERIVRQARMSSKGKAWA